MKDYRTYWNQNVDKWADLYLEISHGHETLDAPGWLSKLYNTSIGKIEARLMRERYRITAQFIEQNVKPKCVFADVGCGTGVFTVQALNRGAQVLAIDFSESAIRITKENVSKHATAEATYVHLDAQTSPIPTCDIALSMGVTPYVTNLESFLENILRNTRELFFCQYTDPGRLSNRLRTLVPILNVRNLIFHSPAKVDKIYSNLGWIAKERRNFATGYIDTVIPVQRPDEQR